MVTKVVKKVLLVLMFIALSPFLLFMHTPEKA